MLRCRPQALPFGAVDREERCAASRSSTRRVVLSAPPRLRVTCCCRSQCPDAVLPDPSARGRAPRLALLAPRLSVKLRRADLRRDRLGRATQLASVSDRGEMLVIECAVSGAPVTARAKNCSNSRRYSGLFFAARVALYQRRDRPPAVSGMAHNVPARTCGSTAQRASAQMPIPAFVSSTIASVSWMSESCRGITPAGVSTRLKRKLSSGGE